MKTIPPYKPISSETHLSDSNSEKEADPATNTSKGSSVQSSSNTTTTTTSSSSSSGKRKSSSNSKISSSSKSGSGGTTGGSKSTTSSHQKSVHNTSSKSTDKVKSNSATVKSAAKNVVDEQSHSNAQDSTDTKTEKLNVPAKEEVDVVENKTEIKENKSVKKRKTNSRTPTPITIVPTDNISVVISGAANLSSEVTALTVGSIVVTEKKDNTTNNNSSETIDKPKKVHNNNSCSILNLAKFLYL